MASTLVAGIKLNPSSFNKTAPLAPSVIAIFLTPCLYKISAASFAVDAKNDQTDPRLTI
jgi:hypothetical protein